MHCTKELTVIPIRKFQTTAKEMRKVVPNIVKQDGGRDRAVYIHQAGKLARVFPRRSACFV